MAIVNLKTKEVNAKIVYYGPGLSGKTTNVQFIYKKLKPEHKGKLMTLATRTDRTLFFDFLPIELGEIRGMKTRFQVYTVPGQVFYNATRKLVLKNVDGIVFVADSSPEKINENIESFENLEENLRFYKKELRDIPHIIQYNKRDVEGSLPVEHLQNALNKYRVLHFEAVANKGKGVLESLTAICKMVLNHLKTSEEVQSIMDEEKEGVVEEKKEAVIRMQEQPVINVQKVPEPAGIQIIKQKEAMPEQKQKEVLKIIGVGAPSIEDGGVIHLPIVLGDENGERFSITLMVSI